MSVTHTQIASLVFVTAVLAWGVPRLLSSLAPTPEPAGIARAIPSVAATANGPLSTAPSTTSANPEIEPAPGTAAPALTTADPTRAGTGESPSATATRQQSGAAPAVSPTSVVTPPPPAASLSEAQEIALQRQLEQQGKSYLRALMAQDAGTVGAMLAGRCAGTDVAALIARRRSEITAVSGVPIDQLTPLNQFVGHFDAAAGEAHTVLQLDNAGTRVQLPTADGWLLEGGSWKSVVC